MAHLSGLQSIAPDQEESANPPNLVYAEPLVVRTAWDNVLVLHANTTLGGGTKRELVLALRTPLSCLVLNAGHPLAIDCCVHSSATVGASTDRVD